MLFLTPGRHRRSAINSELSGESGGQQFDTTPTDILVRAGNDQIMEIERHSFTTSRMKERNILDMNSAAKIQLHFDYFTEKNMSPGVISEESNERVSFQGLIDL